MDIVDFLTVRLDEDEMWAREASRQDEHPIPESGVHWHWEGAHADEPAEPDPGTDPYLRTGSGGYEVSLRSIEEFPSSVGPLPQFAIAMASEVPAAVAGHILRHDPARVLAEVAAKRRILAEHVQVQVGDSPPLHGCTVCDAGCQCYPSVNGWGAEGCNTVRIMASVYADHPDYKESWRP